MYVMYPKYVIVQDNISIETVGAGTRVEQVCYDENGHNPKTYHGKILRIDDDKTIHVTFGNAADKYKKGGGWS